MKGVTTWAAHPYHPAVYDKTDICICRIVPDRFSVQLEWFYEKGAAEHPVLHWKKRTDAGYTAVSVSGNTYTIGDLQEDEEYEFYLDDGVHGSRIRLARTGRPIGTVINYLHPDDNAYDFSGHTLGSPSLLKLPSGALLSSMDLYSNGYPQNLEMIFRSDDGGNTWHYVTELMPCFWGKMFLHNGALYMIGCSTEYGDLLIGRSDDEGKTWTLPTVLFRGSCNRFFRGFCSCPTPVVICSGRIWKGVDYGDRHAYEQISNPHNPAVISAPVDADLLDASSWTLSEPVPYSDDWPGVVKPLENCTCQGCMESNAVVGPNGELYIIPRYQTYYCRPDYGKLIIYKADTNDPEKMLQFDRVIDMNGNTSKFEIIRDEKTGWYLNVLSGLDERNRSNISARNLLMMYKSKDLYNWEYVDTLVDIFDFPGAGIQNPSLVIDGDDLLMSCRTAVNKPIGAMFANYATFHRVRDFRKML